MRRMIVDLSSKDALSPSVAGGKGAALAWLYRQGFRVPSGFVITTAATSRSATGEARLSAAAEPPIREAYGRLGGCVAVRSSLVAEDSVATSFAGQLDTFLDVEGADAVLEAASRCCASFYGERARAYAERNGLNAAAMEMAVVVQRMVHPAAAGVAFSADPLTGESQVVIEGTAGRGDAVVGGLVATDRFVVDARHVLAEWSPVAADAPILAEAQILTLASIIREIERRAGTPQDVEWAWDGEAFHILQSRPITTLVGCHVFSRRIVGDMAPGLIKPLVYQVTVQPKGPLVFGRLFAELLGPVEADYGSLIPRIYSRAYADMTLMGELFERAGLPPNSIEMMYQEERARRKKMTMSPGMFRPLARMVRFGFKQRDLAQSSLADVAVHDAALEPYRSSDWSNVPPGELLAKLEQLIGLRNGLFWTFFLVTMNMVLRTGALTRWTRRQAPEVSFSDLIRGLNGLKGLEPMAEIGQMGIQARDLPPDVLPLLAEADDTTIRSALNETEPGRDLVNRVDRFLHNYGYLSSSGSDFSVAVWAETPTVIWRAINRAAEQSLPAPIQDAAALRAGAVRDVHARMHPAICPAFSRLLGSTMTFIDRRERVSLLMSEYSYQIRRLYLAIADRLVASGGMSQPADIFFLTQDETKALLEGTLDGAEAALRIRTRAAEMEADAAVEPPDVVRGDPARLRPTLYADSPTAAYLSGIGASSGIATGRARVVRDPLEAPPRLGRTDILVVPHSDVGWTPLFPGVGAIVAETGGQLSHTAIVAREYGLPAVVSVKGATRLIRDGQDLVVDGDRGRVYLQPLQA